ncbi:MAG TPA: hypothetical protein VGN16_18000 [Acidobacteriaceae bacterium]|jgi:hypothetical protein
MLLSMPEVQAANVARARSICLWLCVTLLAASSGLRALAQETTYTLHVYTNLFQIATLVLDSRLQLLPPIQADHFSVTIDNRGATRRITL